MSTISPGANVLIIDDDITSSALLAHLLSCEGFHVLAATDGPEGRRIAASECPDIILLDVLMPGENGLETCAKLRDSSATSDVPVIFISSVQEVGSKVAGFEAGAVDYVTKPFDRSEVLARVRVHLRQSRSRRLLVESHVEKLKKLGDAQKGLAPSPDEQPEAGYAIHFRPLNEAGGDFYDVVKVAENVHDYIVADVSGHNLGSSLATGALKAILRQSQSLLYSPREAVLMVSDVISSVLQDGQFVTMLYARLNRGTNKLSVVNAGHPSCIVVNQDGGCTLLDKYGDLLGIHDHPHLETQEISVNPGDRIFLYTDGFLEGYGLRTSPKSAFDAIVHNCRETISIPLTASVDRIAELAFPDPTLVSDDLLMLGVEV